MCTSARRFVSLPVLYPTVCAQDICKRGKHIENALSHNSFNLKQTRVHIWMTTMTMTFHKKDRKDVSQYLKTMKIWSWKVTRTHPGSCSLREVPKRCVSVANKLVFNGFFLWSLYENLKKKGSTKFLTNYFSQPLTTCFGVLCLNFLSNICNILFIIFLLGLLKRRGGTPKPRHAVAAGYGNKWTKL